MGNINRVPAGLQGLLDNQTLGRNPDTLLGDVRPTVSLDPLFLVNTVLKIANNTATSITTKDNVAGVSVPAGAIWWILGVSSRITLASGTGAATINPVITNVGGPVSSAFLELSDTTFGYTFGATGDEFANNVVFPQPLVLRADTRFASRFVPTTVGGGYNITTSVLYYELNA